MDDITIVRTLGTKDYNYIEEISLSKSSEEVKEEKIEPKFHDGRLMISDDSKYGFINENGKKVIDLIYDYAEDFKSELAKVGKYTKKGIRFGYVDISGVEIIKPKYSHLTDFVEGFAIAKDDKGKYVAFNKKGEIITKKEYDFISVFKNGYAIVGLSSSFNHVLFGMIDTNGKKIISTSYQSLTPFKEERSVGKSEEGNWVIFNNKGQIVNILDYDIVEEYDNGYAKVIKNNRCGLIDLTGNEVVEPKYFSIYNISPSLYRIMENNKFGLLDNTGKIIVEPIYDGINEISDCSEDYIVVRKGNYYGLVNHKGEIVTDPIYLYISFEDNYIIFNTRSYSFLFNYKGESFILRKEEVSFDIAIKYGDKNIIRKFDTLEEREKYYEILKKEIENENRKYKTRREETERKLIEEENNDFDLLKEKVKNMKSEVM